MTILSFFFFFFEISVPYLNIMIFKITEIMDFGFFLQNFFPITIEMRNQAHGTRISHSETDIAFIVLSDIKAFEPIARFENTEWKYAFVFIFYNSKWEYQKMNT